MGSQEILGRFTIDEVGQLTVEQCPLIFWNHLPRSLEQQAGGVVNTVLAVECPLLQLLAKGRQQ